MRTLTLALALFLTLTPNAYAFDVPKPDGFVTDSAGILSAEEERSLEIDLQNYRGETSNEIAVFIFSSLEGEAIADLAVEVGREWGVGSAQRDNGLLLLVAVEDRKLFIATGYGLEGAVPDLAAKQIIDREIVPQFKDGNYFGGITAGVEALKLQIGGEYEAIDETFTPDDMPGVVWILVAVIAFFVFFMFYQFFIGVLITISPSRSWWEGGFLGAMFGFFFAGVIGMVVLASIGIATDFAASMLFLKYTPFREFLLKQKKKRKNKEGIWFIGGGGSGRGGSSGGGGGFGGGGFGGGGAGGSW
ncbi:MAG: TPM domain-containing protein [bacterium]|nr:TPM domain-containing protein [bacterium]MDA1292150.1 TPM domain-containing protein [bacterium]